jgi:ELWxxDGT repeat protein
LYYTDGNTITLYDNNILEVSDMTVVGDSLYVHGYREDVQRNIFKTSGVSQEGLELVKVLVQDGDGSPDNLTEYNGKLYFGAYSEVWANYELWVSDGTEEGTYVLKDINPGSSSSDPDKLVVSGDYLYFSAYTDDAGVELWRTDGTEGGTVMVKDIYPGTVYGFSGGSIATAGDRVFFVGADSIETGLELWTSDGTEEGTFMVKDITIDEDSDFESISSGGNILYFSVNTEDYGYELWSSDGTSEGTSLVTDIREGPLSSSPGSFTLFGDALFFFADNGSTGIEPWIVGNPNISAEEDPEPEPEPRRSSSTGSMSAMQRLVNLQNNIKELVNKSEQTPDSPLIFTRNLKIGMTGEDVKALQQFLNSKGFTVSPSGPGSKGNETQMFGALTKNALAKFQAANNITPAAGYFGPITRALVIDMISGENQNTTDQDHLKVRDLKTGMSGDDVKALQNILISLGYNIPAGATGFFGKQTQTALSSYQTSSGINPSSGVFGEKTRSKMKSDEVKNIWW